MIFLFYSAATVGILLQTDTYDATAPAGQSEVIDGLFSTQLGGSTVTPGTEANLTEVFRDNAGVWLEVEVETEILPRVRMDSRVFALNPTTLNGSAASVFATTNQVQTVAAG